MVAQLLQPRYRPPQDHLRSSFIAGTAALSSTASRSTSAAVKPAAMIVRQPLVLTGNEGRSTSWSSWSAVASPGQAGVVRHGITSLLVDYDRRLDGDLRASGRARTVDRLGDGRSSGVEGRLGKARARVKQFSVAKPISSRYRILRKAALGRRAARRCAREASRVMAGRGGRYRGVHLLVLADDEDTGVGSLRGTEPRSRLDRRRQPGTPASSSCVRPARVTPGSSDHDHLARRGGVAETDMLSSLRRRWIPVRFHAQDRRLEKTWCSSPPNGIAMKQAELVAAGCVIDLQPGFGHP